MAFFVYLLVDADAPAFKIGITGDPSTRIAALNQNINRSQSLQIRLESRHDMRGLERTLHFLFRGARYERDQSDGGGFSEWFQIRVFASVVHFVRENRELIGWRRIEPITPPSPRGRKPRRTPEAFAIAAAERAKPAVTPPRWDQASSREARMDAHRASLRAERIAQQSIEGVENSLAAQCAELAAISRRKPKR
jgi:hypothetical protein